jgi:ATP-dependent Clp protease ATP-binding subunit ClpB
LREGHQQFASEHLLKVLLDDPEGLASGLIDRSGGNSREALKAVEAALRKIPKVEGGGAGQLYLAPALARVFDTAEKAAKKAGDSYVTVERMLIALAVEKESEAGKVLARAGVTPQRMPRSRISARAAPPILRRPRAAMTRSSAMRAISPKLHVAANSILSSAATTKSAERSRYCPGAPRTTLC